VLAVLGALGAARTASASGAAALIEWDAPEACLGALDVYARLSSVLGYEPETLGKLSHVRGSVVRTANGYRLVLEAFEQGRRSSRLFEAARCDDLGDAAALAIALALAPPVTERTEPPPPPAESAAGPLETAPALAAEAPGADLRAAAQPGQAWRVRGFAGASAVFEYGALPALAPGVAVAGGVTLGAVSLGAYGVLLGSQLQQVAPEQSVQFSLWFAGVRGCYRLLDSKLELDACASFEAGRFGALGLDLQQAQNVTDPWLAVGAALAARWLFTDSVGIELRAEPALPLVRKEYTVNGSESVHAPAGLSSRLYLGLTLVGG
jgi:hypothetical protein